MDLDPFAISLHDELSHFFFKDIKMIIPIIGSHAMVNVGLQSQFGVLYHKALDLLLILSLNSIHG
jgi:hypothetical protein